MDPLGKMDALPLVPEINAYFEIKSFYISTTAFEPSILRLDLLLDDVSYAFSLVTNESDEAKCIWNLDTPVRLFQTRRLSFRMRLSTLRIFQRWLQFKTRIELHPISVTFDDVFKEAKASSRRTDDLWFYTKSASVADTESIEIGLKVSWKKYGVGDFTGIDVSHMNAGLLHNLEEHISGQESALKFKLAISKPIGTLGKNVIDLLEIGHDIMSIISNVEPIARVVVAALAIPIKIMRSTESYSDQACKLSEQLRDVAREFEDLKGFDTNNNVLFESLVVLLGGLIDGCEALQKYMETGTIKRTVRAQYDSTFETLAMKLREGKEQLHKRINIHLVQEMQRDRELGSLKWYLRPVIPPPLPLGCWPKTRRLQLERIKAWLTDPKTPQKTMWITGSPGAGKTTIASSICSQYSTPGSPVNVFYFFFHAASTVGLNNPSTMWPATAWNMAQRYPDIRSSLFKHAEACPFPSDILVQFEELIVKPLKLSSGLFTEKPLVILVDGLDEGMRGESGKWEPFLATLSQFHQSLSSVNCRLIVLSRDLTHIADYLPSSSHRLHLSVGADSEQKGVDKAQQDVYIYLSANLGVDSDCLEPVDGKDIGQIYDKAAGLFIWVATAVQYLRVGTRIIAGRVEKLLQGTATAGDPTSAVNALYHQVLDTAFSELYEESEKKALRLFLSVTLVTNGTVFYIDQFAVLSKSLQVVNTVFISNLLPLLRVHSGAKYQFSHQSISDFVKTCASGGKYGINLEDGSAILLQHQARTSVLMWSLSTAIEQVIEDDMA